MKIAFDPKTRTFSIQGETGFQLRRLKAWIDTIGDPETFTDFPTKPTFYKNIEDPLVLARVRHQLNMQLSLGDATISKYIPALVYTRNYDKEHGTKILDYGFLIIMHGDVSGTFVGAAISLKDRKGKDIYTFFVPRGEILTHKKMRLSRTRVFSVISSSDEEYKMFLRDIRNDVSLEWKRCVDAPMPVRDKISYKAVIPNTDGEYDYVLDYLEDNSAPVCKEPGGNVYKIGKYYLYIPDYEGDITIYSNEDR